MFFFSLHNGRRRKHGRSMRFATYFDMCCWPHLMNELFCQNFVKSLRRPFEQGLFLFQLFFLVNPYLPSTTVSSTSPAIKADKDGGGPHSSFNTHCANNTNQCVSQGGGGGRKEVSRRQENQCSRVDDKDDSTGLLHI